MIAAAVRWCLRHPWVIWWTVIAALAAAVVLQAASLWLVVAFLPILIASFFYGLLVTGRRSKARAALIVTAIVVLAIAIPLFNNVAVRARIDKARADTRVLAGAVTRYRSHMERLPGALDELTRPATNRRGQTIGALIAELPSEPSSFTPYRYETRPDGTFAISTSGDGVTVKAP